MAMVGLLPPLRGTDLYARLEPRAACSASPAATTWRSPSTSGRELDREVLIEGYRRVLLSLYGPRLSSYFARCRTLLARLRPRPPRSRRPTRAEIAGFLRSIWLQLFSRQGPAYVRFLAGVLLTHPSQFAAAAHMAMKGRHFQRFTQQMLATHAFQAAAFEAYARVEALAERSAIMSPREQAAVRRQASRARHRLHRLHRRLRPEFRKNLVPDWAWIETALCELPREAVGLDLVRRWTPRFRDWFAGAAWRRVLQRSGYAPARLEACATKAPTVAIAPLVEQGRLRRSLEQLFRELGVQLETTRDQLALVGEAGLTMIDALGEQEARLSEYLRAIAHRVDILVVPLADGTDAIGDYVQVLATRAEELPRLVCVGLEGGRRELRRRLIALGIALTGDAARAEIATERACAFI